MKHILLILVATTGLIITTGPATGQMITNDDLNRKYGSGGNLSAADQIASERIKENNKISDKQAKKDEEAIEMKKQKDATEKMIQSMKKSGEAMTESARKMGEVYNGIIKK